MPDEVRVLVERDREDRPEASLSNKPSRIASSGARMPGPGRARRSEAPALLFSGWRKDNLAALRVDDDVARHLGDGWGDQRLLGPRNPARPRPARAPLAVRPRCPSRTRRTRTSSGMSRPLAPVRRTRGLPPDPARWPRPQARAERTMAKHSAGSHHHLCARATWRFVGDAEQRACGNESSTSEL